MLHLALAMLDGKFDIKDTTLLESTFFFYPNAKNLPLAYQFSTPLEMLLRPSPKLLMHTKLNAHFLGRKKKVAEKEKLNAHFNR